MSDRATDKPRDRPALRCIAPWLPVAAWAGLIFWLSATPNLRFNEDEAADFAIRKLGHAGAFGVLAVLVAHALRATTTVTRPGALALLLTLVYAASDEFHQGLVAGRHPAVLDVAIDTMGAALSLLLAWTASRDGWLARGSGQHPVDVRPEGPGSDTG